jgi:DNA-binding XRE family transcriptional regulator
VRDDHHRRHLNLALDVGIKRQTLLGFLNKRKTPSITLCLVYGERTVSVRSSALLKPSVADRNGVLNIDVLTLGSDLILLGEIVERGIVGILADVVAVGHRRPPRLILVGRYCFDRG